MAARSITLTPQDLSDLARRTGRERLHLAPLRPRRPLPARAAWRAANAQVCRACTGLWATSSGHRRCGFLIRRSRRQS